MNFIYKAMDLKLEVGCLQSVWLEISREDLCSAVDILVCDDDENKHSVNSRNKRVMTYL